MGKHLQSEQLANAMGNLQKQFPGLGITLMIFNFGEKGTMSYISNAERGDMIEAMLEFIDKNLDGKITPNMGAN